MPRVLACVGEAPAEAFSVVRAGGLIVYPTDTVYGLGCEPFHPQSVNRLVELKGRSGKPLPVLVSDIGCAERLVDLGSVGRALSSRFWPGALTIVAPIKSGVSLPSTLTCESGSLGVRVPNHRCALSLIKGVGGFLVGTSANRSGDRAPLTLEEAVRSLGYGADLYLDGGLTTLGKESTVLDVSSSEPIVVREGALRSEVIFRFLRGL